MTGMTQPVDTNSRHFNNTLTKLTNISTKISKYIKWLKTVPFMSIYLRPHKEGNIIVSL